MKMPRVSCICITRKRTTYLLRAINCFNSQTYGNKELLIYFESDDVETMALSRQIVKENIHFIEVAIEPRMNLGELRNLSVQNCKGDFFCQWDDDDWYHCQRIELQLRYLLENGKEVGILLYWIIFNELSKEAYLSFPYTWEGSILAQTSIHGNYKYGLTSKSEDTILVKHLIKDRKVLPIIKPTLYIYNYTGHNTWALEHFNAIFEKSTKLSDSFSASVNEILTQSIDPIEGSKFLFSDQALSELDYFPGWREGS